MKSESELLAQCPDFITVIARIKTKMLLAIPGWCRSLNHDLLDRWSSKSHVMAIRSLNDDAEGDSLGVREHAALRTTLGPVDGAWPRFFPPSGALVMAPPIASHDQSMPFRRSYLKRLPSKTL